MTKNLSLNDREARLPLRGMKFKEKYYVFTEPVLSEAEVFRMTRKARFFTSFRMTAQGHFVILEEPKATKDLRVSRKKTEKRDYPFGARRLRKRTSHTPSGQEGKSLIENMAGVISTLKQQYTGD